MGWWGDGGVFGVSRFQTGEVFPSGEVETAILKSGGH